MANTCENCGHNTFEKQDNGDWLCSVCNWTSRTIDISTHDPQQVRAALNKLAEQYRAQGYQVIVGDDDDYTLARGEGPED